MKKVIIVVGMVGWLLMPFIWRSAYLETKTHLDESTLTLIGACKTRGPVTEMNGEPWYSCVKGFSGGYAYRIRNKYFLPFGAAWLATGVGLGAAFQTTRRASNQASHATSEPAPGAVSSALEG